MHHQSTGREALDAQREIAESSLFAGGKGELSADLAADVGARGDLDVSGEAGGEGVMEFAVIVGDYLSEEFAGYFGFQFKIGEGFAVRGGAATGDFGKGLEGDIGLAVGEIGRRATRRQPEA